MQLDNQFSWKTATFMARLSKHAYTGLKDFKKTFKKDWKDIKMFSHGGTECYILTCPKNFTFSNAVSIVFCDMPFFKANSLYDESHVSKLSSALILGEKPTTKIWKIRKKIKIL